MKMRFLLFGILLCGPLQAGFAAEVPGDDTALKIITSGRARVVTRTELAEKLSPAEITVYSPVYQRPMTYQGFWLDEVLKAFGVSLGEQDVVFESSDDFGSSLSPDEVGRQKWLVAYGEPQGWTPLPERNNPTLPGPWYVVGREASSYKEFPWPYQVVAIKIRGDW